MAAYRERLRQDPVAYKKYLEKERQRNQTRKAKGVQLKFKNVADLTEREQRARRKQGRIWSQNFRVRQETKNELVVQNTSDEEDSSEN